MGMHNHYNKSPHGERIYGTESGQLQQSHYVESLPPQRANKPSLQAWFVKDILWPIVILAAFACFILIALYNWLKSIQFMEHYGIFVYLGLGALGLYILGRGAWKAFSHVDQYFQNRRKQNAEIVMAEAAAMLVKNAALQQHDMELIGAPGMASVKVKNAFTPILIAQANASTKAQELELKYRIQELDRAQKLLGSPSAMTESFLPAIYPEPFDFAETLQTWQPSPSGIYLMKTVNEEGITVPLGDTYHIGLAGPSGGGKTNTLRLLLAQSLAAGAEVHLGNPSFAPIKINENTVEDWRPFVPHLKSCVRNIDDIAQLLFQATGELEMRRERQQHDARPGKAQYYAFGEWPAIYAQFIEHYGKKEAEKYVLLYARLLREARQYSIYVIAEFQDALIQTIGGNSGLRENFRTVLYFGGDPISAKALLDLKNGQTIDEKGLGQMGATVLRCKTNSLARGRVPFLSNRAAYMLLGSPNTPLPDHTDELTSEQELFMSNYGAVPARTSVMPYGRTTGALGSIEIKPLETYSVIPPETSQDAENGTIETLLAENEGESETALNGPVEREGDAPESSQITGDHKLMNELQQVQFEAMYPVVGNIGECLRRIEGCNNRHHKHASLIVKQKGLKRK